MEGDTTITIVGTNLGLAATDISLVTIGSSALCNVIDYVVGRRYNYVPIIIHLCLISGVRQRHKTMWQLISSCVM